MPSLSGRLVCQVITYPPFFRTVTVGSVWSFAVVAFTRVSPPTLVPLELKRWAKIPDASPPPFPSQTAR
ncbi:hypothetical protein D3C72_2369310 [compost metagenome]